MANRSAHSAFATPVSGPTRTVAIDAHTVTRAAWPQVLPEFAWVGAFTRVADLLAARPVADVVLLGVHRDDTDAAPSAAWARAIRSLTAAGYRVCLHTSERSAVVLLGCLTAGATAVAHVTDSLDDLRAAVQAAAEGRSFVSGSLTGLAELAARGSALPALTERQQEILSARARGEKFESIAHRLFISRKVAEEHWAAVARKFATFLRDHSPADLERLLGLEPVDMVDTPADRLAG